MFPENTLSAIVATQAPAQQREFLTLKSHGMQPSLAQEENFSEFLTHLRLFRWRTSYGLGDDQPGFRQRRRASTPGGCQWAWAPGAGLAAEPDRGVYSH